MAAASLSLMPVIMPALKDAPSLAQGLIRLLTHTHTPMLLQLHTQGQTDTLGVASLPPDAVYDLWLRQRDEENSYVR